MNALDATFRFQEQAIKVGAERQKLIAANIANADTPHYKAMDIDFAQVLQRNVGGQAPGAALLMTSSAAAGVHAASLAMPSTAMAGSVPAVTAGDMVARTPTQPSMDQNTVDMDVEQGQFADNTIHYQSAFTFLNQQIKTLLSAVQG